MPVCRPVLLLRCCCCCCFQALSWDPHTSLALPPGATMKAGCATRNLGVTVRGAHYFAPTIGSPPNIVTFTPATQAGRPDQPSVTRAVRATLGHAGRYGTLDPIVLYSGGYLPPNLVAYPGAETTAAYWAV